jgi:hypothetical protein
MMKNQNHNSAAVMVTNLTSPAQGLMLATPFPTSLAMPSIPNPAPEPIPSHAVFRLASHAPERIPATPFQFSPVMPRIPKPALVRLHATPIHSSPVIPTRILSPVPEHMPATFFRTSNVEKAASHQQKTVN